MIMTVTVKLGNRTITSFTTNELIFTGDALRMNLSSPPTNGTRYKLTPRVVRALRNVPKDKRTWSWMTEAGQHYNVTPNAINSVLKGRTWKGVR